MELNGYRTVGVLYVLLGLPGLTALAFGRLHRGGDPWFAISFLAVPLGLAFLACGLQFLHPGPRGVYAVRIGGFALAQIAFMFVFLMIVRSGRETFQTAYQFLGMFGSFLSLLAGVLLVLALRQGAAGSGSDRGTEGTPGT